MVDPISEEVWVPTSTSSEYVPVAQRNVMTQPNGYDGSPSLVWAIERQLNIQYHQIEPAASTSYRTEPLRVVSCDPLLRWAVLVVSRLDEASLVWVRPRPSPRWMRPRIVASAWELPEGVWERPALGWTLTEALEMRREIHGPAASTSYRTSPLWIVSSDPLLRWGLLVVDLLDEHGPAD